MSNHMFLSLAVAALLGVSAGAPTAHVEWTFTMERVGVHSPLLCSQRFLPPNDDGSPQDEAHRAHLVLMGSNDGTVYAVHQTNGTLVWSRSLGSRILAGLTLAEAPAENYREPTLLVLTERGDLFGLHPVDGSTRWRDDMQAKVRARPAVVDEARVAFVGAGKEVVAFTTNDGSVLGRWPIGATVHGPLAVRLDDVEDGAHRGTLVVGAENGTVVAFDVRVAGFEVELMERWRADNEGHIDYQSAPLLADARVLVGGYAKMLTAWDVQSGQRLWRFANASDVVAAPVLTPDRASVVFGSSDRTVYKLGVDNGKIEWQVDAEYCVQSAPALLGDSGAVVVAGTAPKRRSKEDTWAGPRVKAFGPQGELLWSAQADGLVHGTPTVSGCAVYFADTHGQLIRVNACVAPAVHDEL